MDRNELIKQAIAQCDSDLLALQEQRALLLSSLKPTIVKKNGTTPKTSTTLPTKEKAKPNVRKAAPPTAEEIHKVFECFGSQPQQLSELESASGLKGAKLRACLDALVDNGDVIQSGTRRSLRFLARGVEYDG